MKIIDPNVTARQAQESSTPLALVPKPRPYFTRARSVRVGSPTNKSVFACLATFANPETGACWPSIPSLVAATELGRSSVCRALAELERDGFISRQRSKGGRATTRYRLAVPEWHPQQSHSGTAGSPRVPPLAVPQWDPKSNREELYEESVERESPRPRAREAPKRPRGTPSLSLSPEYSETLTCPKCKRSWPESFGDVCHDCNASIPEIRRRLEEVGKYDNVPIRSIDGKKKVQEQRKYHQAQCAERERITAAQRVEDQQREEQRLEQEQDPEFQAEQVRKAAEQKRKANEAHHLRLETLKAKQSELHRVRTV